MTVAIIHRENYCCILQKSTWGGDPQNPQNINDPDASLLDIFLKECNLLYKSGIYISIGIANSKQSTHEMSYGIH